MNKIKTKDKICKQCKKKFNRGRLKSGRIEAIEDYDIRKYCSHKCFFNHNQGKNHPNWGGGIKHRPDGYLRDNKTDKYLHRIIMEKHLGRKMKSTEVIHHKNGNPSDNKIKNLEVMSNSEHRKLHIKKKNRNKKGEFVKDE